MKILFLDIETTTQYPTFMSASDEFKRVFERRFKKEIDELGVEEAFNVKGPIYPEIGKIVCISVGYLEKSPTGYNFRTRSFVNEDERELLLEFTSMKMIETWDSPGPAADKWSICGHNIMNFDIPFIIKRLLINRIHVPGIFKIMGKKPWDITHLKDTKEMWKMTVWDGASNSALDTLCFVFGLETSKDDISGKDVKDVYWIENNVQRIAIYCEKDVFAQAQVYLHINEFFEIADNLVWINRPEQIQTNEQ